MDWFLLDKSSSGGGVNIVNVGRIEYNLWLTVWISMKQDRNVISLYSIPVYILPKNGTLLHS